MPSFPSWKATQGEDRLSNVPQQRCVHVVSFLEALLLENILVILSYFWKQAFQLQDSLSLSLGFLAKHLVGGALRCLDLIWHLCPTVDPVTVIQEAHVRWQWGVIVVAEPRDLEARPRSRDVWLQVWCGQWRCGRAALLFSSIYLYFFYFSMRGQLFFRVSV